MLLVITLTIISAITVEGGQRIVHVSESISDNGLPNDSDFTCCVYGNCSCNSFDIALASLTSDVLINITTDVTLSSIVKQSDLKNISIIGYNNPTVNCTNSGGIHFTLCHNCIFKDITWDGCGSNYTSYSFNHAEERPGLKLSYSSNIMIQNCHFQHSIGRVVTLLMSINVTISNCRFINNQGTCVYAINQNIQFDGKILFQNNTGKHGSSICICNSMGCRSI